MKCLPHIICALLIISFGSPQVLGAESLLFAERQLNQSERKMVAKRGLEILEVYDLNVPKLSPREKDYVFKELEFNTKHNWELSQRSRSFTSGREYITWSIRKDLDAVITLLNFIINNDIPKIQEIKIWTTIVGHLINGTIVDNYDAGHSRGYFKKDLKGDHLHFSIYYQQILEQNVLKQLE